MSIVSLAPATEMTSVIITHTEHPTFYTNLKGETDQRNPEVLRVNNSLIFNKRVSS